MAVIVDASIAAAWVLVDEQNDAADAIMFDLKTKPASVPALFWFEVRNLIVMAERRGQIGTGGAMTAIGRLRRLNLTVQNADSDHAVLSLAFKHNLSAYDASYLALAINENFPLATADKRLAAAAVSEAVELLGPLRNKL